MLCAKSENDWFAEIHVIDESSRVQDVFSTVSYILMAPSTHNVSVLTHNLNI